MLEIYRKSILFITVLLSSQLIAQNVSVSMNSGYTNQIFYSMSGGEVANITNEDWDIAFSTDAFSSTIRINDGKGVELYTYHLGDTSAWANINSSTPNILTDPMYNSDTEWDVGAFDVNTIGGFDYGWGVYSMVSHHIVGDSLFIIKTIDGNYKKLWMESKASGEYFFKYADLDGGNLATQSVAASNYNSKNFVYFSLNQNTIIDREPNSNSWDITFLKYITDYPFQGSTMPYSVTGVFQNKNIEVAQVDGISSPSTYTDYSSHTFNSDINTIGYDWKTYQGLYVITSNRCYFVRDLNGDIWRLLFTNFDGTSTGNIQFNSELMNSSTDINELNQVSTFIIYPNPTSGNVNIVYEVTDNNLNLVVSDMSGRMVHQQDLLENGLYNIDFPTHNLSKGLYIISLEDNQSPILKKKLIVK